MAQPTAAASPARLVFIDPAVADYQTLLQALPADMERVILDPARDGLAQIAEALTGRSGLDAIHIISHGGPGLLHLGGSALTLAGLASHADALASIGGALREDGDILLYGCDVAAGETGAAFIQALAAATGAEVAASTDPTGAAALGGNWALEAATGPIEAAPLAALDYAGLLDNTAPTLDPAATPALTGIAEDATYYSGNNGNRVASLVVDGSIIDPDGPAVEAIAVYAVDNSHGTWQYKVGLNGWRDFDFSGDHAGKALLLAGTDSVRFLPAANFNGAVPNGLSFHAWDQSAGAAGDYLAVSGHAGGDQPLSIDTNTASISVAAVNDAPTFSLVQPGTGKVATNTGPGADVGHGATVQADGKILVVGYSRIAFGNDDVAVARYNPDGSLDTSFDGDGWLTMPILSAGNDRANAVTVQDDGKILVAGYTEISFHTDRNYSALLRYNSDGSLDTSFGNGGKVINGGFTASTGTHIANDVAVTADGKILLAGNFSDSFRLLAYDSNGLPDTTFSSNLIGSFPADLVGNFSDPSSAQRLAIQADGKILVAGYNYEPTTGLTSFALLRINSDGTVDTGFGGDGSVHTTLGYGFAYQSVWASSLDASDYPTSLAVQADGKILVTAARHIEDPADPLIVYSGAVVLRYNADGSLDTGFGSGGIIVSNNGDSPSGIFALADGKILVEGEGTLTRYNPDGSLDSSFGSGGLLNKAFSGGVGASLQADGKILATGKIDAGANIAALTVVRFNSDGSPDTSFGATPVSTLSGAVGFTESGTPVIVDSDVQITDADLAALNGGLGDYAGAILTVARQGGVNGQDGFGFDTSGALFTLDGNRLQSGGQTFASFTDSGGTLSIHFTSDGTPATQALVNDVARHILYSNSADAPPANVQLNWVFNDGNSGAQGPGGAASVSGTSTVTITATNDAPVLDSAPALELPDISKDLADAANPGTTVAALVVDGSITDPDGTAVEAIAVSAVDASHGVWQYKLGAGAWTDFDFSGGNAGKALLLGPADSVRFVPAAGYNGTVTDGLSFHAWDQSAGSAGAYLTVSGNTGGTGPLSTATDSASIAVNDAPTLDAAPAPALADIAEDVADAANPGTTVANVVVDGAIADPDGTALEAIAVSAVDASHGVWQYKIGAGTWTDFDFSGGNAGKALLLGATDSVRFLPASDFNGSANFTFHAWDQTFGGAGDYLAVSGNTGSHKALSTVTDTASVTVTPVNDAPGLAGLPGTVSHTEGGAAVVLDTDVDLSDIEFDAANSYVGATLTLVRHGGADASDLFGASGTLSFAGTLAKVGGVAIGTYFQSGGALFITFNGNATPALVDSLARQITYHNGSAAPPDSVRIDWTFSDGNSGDQGPGDPLDASGYTTVNITAVNSPPTVAHALTGQNATEDAGFFYVVPANTFSDPDETVGLNYAATRADGSPLPGWLSFDPASRAFHGTPTNGDVGSLQVKVTATDSASAPASSTFTLSVVNTNDAPVVAHPLADQSATEHQPFSFQVPANAFADVDAGDGLAYTATRSDGSVLPGWLGFDPATRTFSGTPDNGDATLGVTVTATDGASAKVSDEFVLSVTAVNDAPQFGHISGTANFVKGGPAVILSGAADLIDPELDAANNYAGSTLSLKRQGTASPDDVFGGTDPLRLLNGEATLLGSGGSPDVVVGHYLQENGTLFLAFNANATASRVDEVLRHITYQNTAASPPDSVQIDWQFNDGGAQGAGGALVADAMLMVDISTACFLRGTRILTRAGYVPVETLRPGDEVRTLSHGWRPVVWLGFRHVSRNVRGRFDHAVQPVRIVRDAFGEGLPARDVWLSPDHAVFFRDHLIPAKALVNGHTVTREPEVDSITYYHVLLDRHAVVFSDGLPTESYCPQENLDAFENLADCPAAWRSDLVAPIGLLTDCHPRTASGPVVESARAFLARRAIGESGRTGIGENLPVEVAVQGGD